MTSAKRYLLTQSQPSPAFEFHLTALSFFVSLVWSSLIWVSGDTENLDLTAERERERERAPVVGESHCSVLTLKLCTASRVLVLVVSGLCIVLYCNATPLFPPPAVAVWQKQHIAISNIIMTVTNTAILWNTRPYINLVEHLIGWHFVVTEN